MEKIMKASKLHICNCCEEEIAVGDKYCLGREENRFLTNMMIKSVLNIIHFTCA